MIISFNGDLGSGKSTIAKKVASALNYEHFYMGQILRDMAKKRGLTLLELLKISEKNPSIDREIEDFIINLAKKKKNFVIESRTAWHFIPASLKIYFKVDVKEGAKRILQQLKEENNRNEGVKTETLKDVMKSNQQRKASEDRRYKKFYGINIRNMANYDFVLDTTKLNIEKVFEKTINFIRKNLA